MSFTIKKCYQCPLNSYFPDCTCFSEGRGKDCRHKKEACLRCKGTGFITYETMGSTFEFVFEGPPVPYVRMNSRNTWTERVQNYLAYKGRVSKALQDEFPHLVDFGPPKGLTKDRRRWLKGHRDTIYHLYFTVYEEREKGDWDNYGKVIGDALQNSGLIVNDKKIKGGTWKMAVDKDYPRIEFVLTTGDGSVSE